MIIGWDRFNRAVNKTVESVESSPFCPNTIVAVGISGLIPATIVAKKLRCKDVKILVVESYSGKQRLQPRLVSLGLTALAGKQVLCVDDIVATGETFELVRQQILKHKPQAVKFAAPIISKRICKTYPDFWGEAVMRTKNDFIRFPWDEEGNGKLIP